MRFCNIFVLALPLDTLWILNLAHFQFMRIFELNCPQPTGCWIEIWISMTGRGIHWIFTEINSMYTRELTFLTKLWGGKNLIFYSDMYWNLFFNIINTKTFYFLFKAFCYRIYALGETLFCNYATPSIFLTVNVVPSVANPVNMFKIFFFNLFYKSEGPYLWDTVV